MSHYYKDNSDSFILEYLFVFVIIFAVIGCLVGCDMPVQEKDIFPKYKLSYEDMVPDSSKAAYAKWVKETVSAASFHMTGGDYEDPEDVIEQAESTGMRLFSVRVEGLKRYDNPDDKWGDFVPLNRLSKEELDFYNSLKNKKIVASQLNEN